MNSNSKNLISNSNNYNISFQDNLFTIFSKYLLIINEFLKHSHENIYIQNQSYYGFILKQGIITLTHVFKMLLMYTKNLDIVYHNCQKSYIYYIEFISQIGDDNHSFLQLNSKDASLFVYKKTIFEIDNDIRKNYVSDTITTQLINKVDILIKIYNTLLIQLIENHSLVEINKIIDTSINNIMLKIIKLSDNNDDNKLKAISIFISTCKKDNIIDHLDLFIKKIKKKQSININKLEHKLIEEYHEPNIIPNKYISTLLNEL